MLPLCNRITKTKDFNRVKRQGKVFRGFYFTTIVLSGKGENPTRFGFITSKKLGKGVVRNRIKRKIREQVRLFLPYLKPGFDIIIIGRNKSMNVPSSRLKKEIEKKFQEMGILKKGVLDFDFSKNSS